MRPIFLIEGVDYSALINKYEYTVSYTKRLGKNGGVMLDGSTTEDVLARKAVISIDTNGMRQNDISSLLTALSVDTMEITYLDPLTALSRTATFTAEIGDIKLAFYRASVPLYNATTITLTEV